NNGIKFPDSLIETTLFDSLYAISYDSSFSAYGYNLEKLYYLSSDSNYSEYDKMYARSLLEEPKELINRYVHFTNTEPDEERCVLVQLALYFDALSRKCLLNKNIPNTLDFRMQILSDDQYAELFLEEENDNPQAENTSEDLLELLKEYGG
ncbi:MAG: hypothetical protein PUH33_00400, partial [Clostridiaceae bacterium]|nr:hypothetical protein [Clostridiaceae bacterium]